MKKQIRKNIEKGVLFGLVCAIMMSFARFDTRCEELRTSVLRLHILANSDSEDDQQLKLKVRDKILSVTSERFNEARNLSEAIEIAKSDLDVITAAAQEEINASGYDYTVTANIEKNFFNNRDYDDFTLPAGVYNSLTVRIGNAEGHNWWCVVFPGVCLPAAEKTTLKKAVSGESAKVASNAKKYKICFKTVEIYQKIRHKFSKK